MVALGTTNVDFPGQGVPQSQATDLVLSQSTVAGPPIRLRHNRRFLARTIELGFREVLLPSRSQTILCYDPLPGRTSPLRLAGAGGRPTVTRRLHSGRLVDGGQGFIPADCSVSSATPHPQPESPFGTSCSSVTGHPDDTDWHRSGRHQTGWKQSGGQPAIAVRHGLCAGGIVRGRNQLMPPASYGEEAG